MTSKFGSIFPEPVPPRDDVAESVQEEVLESRPGEVDFDKVVRAETLAPRLSPLSHVYRTRSGLPLLNSLAEIRAIQPSSKRAKL